MSTLLLRLSGPLQSWGTRSRFSERDTDLEPSKSGVVGLVCAAFGRDRSEPVGDLVALRMGVRVDREGTVIRDFHTAMDVVRADGVGRQETVVSNRYYLSDAVFLVGLEGDESLLVRIDTALQAPRWPLFLGRKGCPPGEPVRLADGMQTGVGLEAALAACHPLIPLAGESDARTVIECRSDEAGLVRQDVPLSFALGTRRFATRMVRNGTVRLIPVKEEVVACST